MDGKAKRGGKVFYPSRRRAGRFVEEMDTQACSQGNSSGKTSGTNATARGVGVAEGAEGAMEAKNVHKVGLVEKVTGEC